MGGVRVTKQPLKPPATQSTVRMIIKTYLDGVAKLRKHGIQVCTHLINGLPGETLEMMRENVRKTILDSDIQGIKLHLLHLMRNTRMLRDYHEGKLQLMQKRDLCLFDLRPTRNDSCGDHHSSSDR